MKSERESLVQSLIKKGYLHSKNVINAMLELPREEFLPEKIRHKAYIDSPQQLFSGQTISAPHMNAMMCEILDLKPSHKVLEIGTGSGYHAALCALIVGKINDKGQVGHVYTIERIRKLAEFARENIKRVGLEDKITVICGDGTIGYPESAPYDRILVTAASPKIPEPLIEQLKVGGLICIPVGSAHFSQKLILGKKTRNGFEEKEICGVIFVPLIGKHGF
ncbi:MAG: protein-L-isoaspartate(D-aspartate) O-methyltransferase [Promethearchaeota archaeon]